MSSPRKRKNLFVDPKVQSALAVRLAVHWFLFAGIVAVISISLQWFANPLKPLGTVASAFLQNQWPVLLTMVLLLPMFIYDSLKLSNRFAGPIIRFRRHIRGIADGGPTDYLTFRKGDFWHDLAGDFNRMIDRLKSDQDSAKKSSGSAQFVQDDLAETTAE